MKSQKKMELESLPDEIWMRMLEIGIQNFTLGCEDLCSLSLSCKLFNKFSTQDTLWSALLTRNFPSSSSKSSSSSSSSCSKKSIYAKLVLARNRRIVLNRERRLGRLARKIKRIQRELKFVNEQLGENSGELLTMVQDRYVVCRRLLVKVKNRHMLLEKEVSGTYAKHVDKDDVFEDDTETSSSKDSSEVESEESLEDESEEDWEDGSEDLSDNSDDKGF